MYQTPKRAKRLYFDVIPKSVDDYLLHLQKYSKNCFDNPVYHVHKGEVPSFDTPITFTLLLNLASACHAESREILEDFVNRYLKEDVKYHPFLSKLIDSALNYYQDFVAPHKVYRNPTSSEKDAILDLYEKLQKIDPNSSPEELQNLSFSVGKKYFSDLKAWFSCLYEVLLGQKEGPRLGSFIKIYGVNNMYNLIKERLNL
jgi:lysyl-tRNA synthetase class 1